MPLVQYDQFGKYCVVVHQMPVLYRVK